MEKQILISTISEKLNQMRISNSMGNGTDITVNAEFLGAGWSTGSKKITYEASIFADERSNTVFMWEMTKEVFSNLTNDKPWPKGDYKVEIFIENKKTPNAAVNFKVAD